MTQPICPTWRSGLLRPAAANFGEKSMLKQFSVAVCVSFTMLLSAAGCATEVQDPSNEEQVAAGEAELSGACLQPAFDKCIDARGGGGCVKYCTGACMPEVERCARGGGGRGCAKRCGTGCVVNSTWTPGSAAHRTALETRTTHCLDESALPATSTVAAPRPTANLGGRPAGDQIARKAFGSTTIKTPSEISRICGAA
jgi:hypothetical protein